MTENDTQKAALERTKSFISEHKKIWRIHDSMIMSGWKAGHKFTKTWWIQQSIEPNVQNLAKEWKSEENLKRTKRRQKSLLNARKSWKRTTALGYALFRAVRSWYRLVFVWRLNLDVKKFALNRT